MAFRSITVTTTPQQIVAFNPARNTLTIANDSGSKCYISGDSLTPTTLGFPLSVGAALSLVRREGDDAAAAVYAATLAGTADVRINEGFQAINP